MTTEQKTQLERAIEIAKEKNHKVHTAIARATGETVYLVRSHTNVNHFYVLSISEGRIHCQCECSKQGRICSHAGAVRIHLLAQREALATIEQAEAQERQAAEQRKQEFEQHFGEGTCKSVEQLIELAREEAIMYADEIAAETPASVPEQAERTSNCSNCGEEYSWYVEYWHGAAPGMCRACEDDDYQQSKAPEGFTYEEYQAEEAGVTAGDLADAQSPERESGLEWETGSSLPLDRPGFARSPLGFLKV